MIPNFSLNTYVIIYRSVMISIMKKEASFLCGWQLMWKLTAIQTDEEEIRGTLQKRGWKEYELECLDECLKCFLDMA